MDLRFDRNVKFFGREGQARLREAKVAVVGVGGVGTHVVQQLALLGVGRIVVIDGEELERTNLNRYVGARHDDPIPGTQKVDIAERIVSSVDPSIAVERILASVVTADGFAAVRGSDYVFGCVDREGVRLILTELCSAYRRPYFDIASEIDPRDRLVYGGRVCVAWDGKGCLFCLGALDRKEAAADLRGPGAGRDEEAIYGVKQEALTEGGPSVVSINGVVVSLGVTEFLLAATGLRPPKRLLNYHGHMGKVTVSIDPPEPDCHFCTEVYGRESDWDVGRYLRQGVGDWLR